ncbi:2-oxoglutarate-dependent dioxygenase [Paucibacter sp. KBW04]|uniref:2OG-Fe(II) oxygenase n=1 Tax=Paucibacter sp. KBW04 TaxID=2153361 RepID=UPI000F585EDF|nr:2OG-Fe(II) oxygenase [Paucibacter sp. KBW04]RQO56013.1 2-oxoglutarate-dependent dioxygenase [Paucibacter sp. KBW04]
MSLQLLKPEWQAWVRENVARGCTPASMQELLLQGGHPAALAKQAIAEAQADHSPGQAQPSALALLAAQRQAQAQLLPGVGEGNRLRPQIDVQANSLLAPDGQRVQIAAVLEHPQIVLFNQMLSDEECGQLMRLAETRLSRSTVVDEQLGEARAHEARTSAGAWFQRAEFELLSRIEARLAALLHWPVDRGEGLQVLRYAAGGEYRAHFDYFNPGLPGSQRHLQTGGQRVGTCILYLDEVEAGGATRFPSLGFEVRPRRGAALYFASVDGQGVEDPATLHAGLPVLSGVKYIATKWLRQRAYL